MLKVNTLTGSDEDYLSAQNIDSHTFKTLEKAIEVSKTGDTISLSPGVFECFKINSFKTNYELKILGSGLNSVCKGIGLTGYFDFTVENAKLQTVEINSSNSRFNFINTKFTSLNIMELNKNPRCESEDKTVYITFERCIFDYNFQIIMKDGDYVISFVNCQFNSKIPLMLAKKGNLKVNLTNVNFENTLIKNDKAIVEYSYVSCNFPPDIPLFIGSPCMDKSREKIQSILSTYETPRKSTVSGQNENDSSDQSVEYQKERDGAISFSSNDFDQIKLRRYTRLVNNTGEATLKVILADEADNGHQVVIISENAPVVIDEKTYREPYLIFGFIYDYGWIKFPSFPSLPSIPPLFSKK